MTRPRARARRTPPMISSMTTMPLSDPDVDDLPHPQVADAGRHDGGAQEDVADRGGEELAGVVLVHGEHDRPEPDGEGDEDVGTHPALGCEARHVATQALPLDHGLGDGEEELGEVATDLAL